MRVLTQNVWGHAGDWPARRRVVREGLASLAPDLVSFQEAIVQDDYDQVVDILGPGFHVFHATRRGPDRAGASIASRWPFTAIREVDLQLSARTADFPCVALLADVDAPAPIGGVLFVQHWPSWQLDYEREREQQAVIAARAIADALKRRPAHVVLAGDLDADPFSSSVRFWTGRTSLEGLSVCYRDAWESVHGIDGGETFTPRNPVLVDWDWPFRRIDYVFVRCGKHGGPTLAIDRCEVVFDEPDAGTWASDHFGVMADLVVPPRSIPD